MNVVIEAGLEEMHAYLASKGHRVSFAGSKDMIPDALVFRSLGAADGSAFSQNVNEKGPILLVYARNMTPESVAEVLEKRCYGGIFSDLPIL